MAIMKKSIFSFCIFVAALLWVGCQKEITTDINLEEATHSVVFTAEKIIDTRTAIASEGDGIVSYKWVEGDEGRMYITETSGTTVNVGTVTTMILSNDNKTATFNVRFSGSAPTGDILYKAVYAGSFSSKKNPFIPNEQSPLPTSFDPNADVMVSDVITRTSRDENPATFRFNMKRKVSVNKMTLKGLESGEVISSVSFESDKIHSTYYLVSDESYDESNGSKKLTFTYTANNTVPSTGDFPVYFTTVPVEDATFTVTVVTNQHRYRKTSKKAISFALGEVRRFNVNLAGCVQPEGKVFKLVTDANQLQIGSEVVIAANGVKNTAMSTTQNENNRGTTDATKSSDRSTITINDQVQVFTLRQGMNSDQYAFSFENNNDTYYLYAASSSKNWLRSQSSLDGNASWTISISDKEATIKAQGNNTRNILRYNSGDDIFSCYSSGQQTVYIYQASSLPYPEMSWSASSATASITTNSGIIFDAPILIPGNASSVDYLSSAPSVATIATNGTVTVVGEGSTTISAIFNGNEDYAPQTVSYTLTVTDDREIVATPSFSTSGAVASGTEVTITCSTTGATIYYTTGSSDFSVGDWSAYSGPIIITAECTLKAIATKDNYKNSEIVSASYTITGAPFSVWEDNFSKCSNSTIALSTLSGSINGFTDKYSEVANTFPMNGAIRIGKASAPGRLITPVLSKVVGSSANLTVTFKAAGWKDKATKMTLSVNKGAVIEGQTTIISENSMTGNSPSMAGTVYTFHITGADKTTIITFNTTHSIGIDDLVVTQTN